MLSPIMRLSASSFCKLNMVGQSGYCDWLFESESRRDKYQELMGRWVESGVVPGEMGDMHFMVNWSTKAFDSSVPPHYT